MGEVNYFSITIGNFTIRILQHVLYWLLSCLIVAIILYIVGKKFKKADPSKPPNKLLLVFELIVDLITGILKGNLSTQWNKFTPFFGTIILVIAVTNISGLVGLTPATTNVGINLTLSVMMFLLSQYSGLKAKGLKEKAKELCQPMFFLLPLNIIGEISSPISMALRLFGNILSGGIIIMLLYSFMQYLGFIGIIGYTITPFLHLYFDIFSGLIQAYVFVMLGSFFLGSSIEE